MLGPKDVAACAVMLHRAVHTHTHTHTCLGMHVLMPSKGVVCSWYSASRLCDCPESTQVVTRRGAGGEVPKTSLYSSLQPPVNLCFKTERQETSPAGEGVC